MGNRIKILLTAFLLGLALFFSACGQAVKEDVPPFFTDPLEKLAELKAPAFTTLLFFEALELDPTLDDANTHVHMGYWSLSVNRGRLITVLDAINSYVSTEAYQAIWDEGVSTALADQYPSYNRMNKEYWYERAYPLSDGTVSIEGVHYTDPYPVTPKNADDIWGEYSKRYADIAALLREKTGITPEARCFVQGARINRIFYAYELPQLASLEALGDVKVFFALTSEANWLSPSDWAVGTSNAPTPEPAARGF